MNIIAALTTEVAAINTLKNAPNKALWGGVYQTGCHFLVWLHGGVRLAVMADERGAETYPLGEAFIANDEMLVKLRAYKEELDTPPAGAAKAAALAAAIITYCREKSLCLDGIVAELEAGQPLDAERAKRLTTYCDQVQCLTLGGLVDQVWELRNEMHEASLPDEDGRRRFDPIDDKTGTMGNSQPNVTQHAFFKAMRAGDALEVGHIIHERLLSGPIEGDFIPARPASMRLYSADELRSMMAFNPADWAHGPATVVTESAPCAGFSKPMMPLSQYKQMIGRVFRTGTFEFAYGADAFASAARAAEAGHPVHLGKNPGEKWKVTVEPRQ